jgi:hypothetical protein
MVTDVETAGLILATFPLIIEGLKFYLEGLETIKRWWRYIKTLKHLIRKIAMEETKFENSCTELLSGIVDGADFELLLSEPGGKSWRRTDILTSLQQRLGGSFNVYLEAVLDMKEVLDEFREKLELDSSGKVRKSNTTI